MNRQELEKFVKDRVNLVMEPILDKVRDHEATIADLTAKLETAETRAKEAEESADCDAKEVYACRKQRDEALALAEARGKALGQIDHDCECIQDKAESCSIGVTIAKLGCVRTLAIQALALTGETALKEHDREVKRTLLQTLMAGYPGHTNDDGWRYIVREIAALDGAPAENKPKATVEEFMTKWGMTDPAPEVGP
jgi:hypothetical protein